MYIYNVHICCIYDLTFRVIIISFIYFTGTWTISNEVFQKYEKKTSKSTMRVNGHQTHGVKQEMGKVFFSYFFELHFILKVRITNLLLSQLLADSMDA